MSHTTILFFAVLTLLCLSVIDETEAGKIVVTNQCPHPVWVGAIGQTEPNGHKWSNPGRGGFRLDSGNSRELTVEVNWAGRVWGRTNCDSSGRCETGDCDGKLECQVSGQKPATLAEITFDGWGGNDYYDISLVDGGNLRMRTKPRVGNCREGSCPHDMTKDCPAECRMCKT